jgi:preprotein translocase subunit SecG
MIGTILIIHVLIAVALIGVILIQRSEGGALGMGGGGGGGGMGGLMTARGSANMLTRVTAGLAVCFFASSITLAIMAGGGKTQRSIVDQPATSAPIEPTGPQLPRLPSN